MKKETNWLHLHQGRILKPYKSYFWDFYNPLNISIKEKVDYVMQIVISAGQIPIKFFKHIENGIYEIRIEVGGNIYRIFSFFEANNILILLHAFQKKKQKN